MNWVSVLIFIIMYLGLDLSLTGSGVVIIDDNYSILFSETLSVKSRDVERLLFLENKLFNILQDKSITIAAIEGPAYQDTGRIFELGEWAGVVKLNLYKLSIPYIIVAPMQLKKYVSGSGKSGKKELILLDVFKNFGEEIRDNNIADAYVLSRIARDFYYLKNGKEYDIKKYQEDVIKKISRGCGIYEERALI